MRTPKTVVDKETGELKEFLTCTVCGEDKDPKFFYKHKRDGYESTCKACKPLHMATQIKAEHDKIKAITSKIDEALPVREYDNELFLALVRPNVKTLTDELMRIGLESEKDDTRIKAITYVLDRVLGKSDQTLIVKNSGTEQSRAETFLNLWPSEDEGKDVPHDTT